MPAQVGIRFVLILIGAALAILMKEVSYSPGYLARKQSPLETFQDTKGNSLRWTARMLGICLVGIGLIAIIEPIVR